MGTGNNKDVLILGEEEDYSTFEVIDYLIRDSISYIKINNSDRLENSKIVITSNGIDFTLNYENYLVQLHQIKAYWYRRGAIAMVSPEVDKSIGDSISVEINNFLFGESKSIFNLANHVIENIPVRIGAFSKHNTEKLIQLTTAVSCNLDIPETFICTTKNEIRELLNIYDKLATKGIKNNFNENSRQSKDKPGYCMFTSLLDNKDLSIIPEKFSSTLFQAYIKKKYELRIFFLHGIFYAMSIFSQNNPKTQIDFRHYDSQNPNRTTPFQLPQELKVKLGNLMSKLGLDTGSIDMIVSPEERYVFLEVNPDGQFGMVSYPCNYYIEKKIAEILSRK